MTRLMQYGRGGETGGRIFFFPGWEDGWIEKKRLTLSI